MLASAFFYQERRPQAAYASPREERGEGVERARRAALRRVAQRAYFGIFGRNTASKPIAGRNAQT